MATHHSRNFLQEITVIRMIRKFLLIDFANKLKASFYFASIVLMISVVNSSRHFSVGAVGITTAEYPKQMTQTTTLALFLGALGVLFLRKAVLRSPNRLPHLGQKLTWSVLGVAFIIVLMGVWEWRSDTIDLNLFLDKISPGQSDGFHIITHISPPAKAVTSTLIILSGLTIFTLTWAPSWPWAWQLFPCLGIMITVLFCYGFLFSVPISKGNIDLTGVPLSTCISFLLLYVGQLFIRPDVGMLKPFHSEYIGGKLLRSRGPALALVFFTLAVFAHMGFRYGFYDSGLGFTLFITLSSISFFLTFYALANSFNNAHSRLRDSELFSKRILEVCPGIITIFRTADQRFVFVSNQVSKILGYSDEDLRNDTSVLSHLVHPEDLARLLDERKKISALPDNAIHTYSFRWQRKDGTFRTLLTTSTPYRRDAKGRVTEVLTFSSDVTDLVVLQDSLKQANYDLEKERKKILRSNHDLEIFAGVAAHDLKSPLQSLVSWIGILKDSSEDFALNRSDVFVNAINFIERNARKSIGLINDILNISRLNSESAESLVCDIGKALTYVLQVLELDIKKSQAKIMIGDLHNVAGIPVQYETLFSNLIRNAINYRSPTRPLEIEIGSTRQTEMIEFYVRDNGLGIPPEHQDTIFELFKRAHADDEHPGNGLGLAYCRKVVELRGGKIWVESVAGQGSTFKFCVPHSQVAPE